MNSTCFLGKNADRILRLLVREIKLSECVETGRRLRRVRFDDVRFDLVDVVQIGPFPPLPESPGHVHGHPQGGFVRLSLLFAGWAAFPGTPIVNLLSKVTPFCRPIMIPSGRKDSWRGAAARPARRTNHPNPFYADHPWLPFHRCPMRRSFYNQKGVKFRRNFPS